VTPGVRSAGSAKGDQQRVATPGAAVRNGANYVVMGRQITRAADPAAEVERVLEEIAASCEPRVAR
jgi:orotidine-5'-phosphate decarboxylase